MTSILQASPTLPTPSGDQWRTSIDEEDSSIKTPGSSREGPDIGEDGGDGEQQSGPAEVPHHTQLQRWTRALLFQLLVDIVEVRVVHSSRL